MPMIRPQKPQRVTLEAFLEIDEWLEPSACHSLLALAAVVARSWMYVGVECRPHQSRGLFRVVVLKRAASGA